MSAQHFVNYLIAVTRMGQGFSIAALCQRALCCVNHPKAAIQPALLHTWQIDLGVIFLPIMAPGYVKPGSVKHKWCIQMAVKHQKIIMSHLVH